MKTIKLSIDSQTELEVKLPNINLDWNWSLKKWVGYFAEDPHSYVQGGSKVEVLGKLLMLIFFAKGIDIIESQ